MIFHSERSKNYEFLCQFGLFFFFIVQLTNWKDAWYYFKPHCFSLHTKEPSIRKILIKSRRQTFQRDQEQMIKLKIVIQTEKTSFF